MTRTQGEQGPVGYTLPLRSEFADAFPELAVPWRSIVPDRPTLVVLNEPLARELGLDPAVLRTPAGVRALLGNELAPQARPVAQVYAGHQFGGYSPRLGDGRALLLGELATPDGELGDVHLKGSGPTPFSRGGDGFAALGPMLREYLVSEAMHAQDIPTTRALAVIATGRQVPRDGELLPGAILVRVAASHLRVGTFQYARATNDAGLLTRLTEFALARHVHRGVGVGVGVGEGLAAGAPREASPALELLAHVVQRQAELIAQWTVAGFVHGVMNTDNMTLSGETIDYGPCAFLDRYDPAVVFSSIDHQGRYAFGAQPDVALWNLTRLAEALLPIVGGVAGVAGVVGDAGAAGDSGAAEQAAVAAVVGVLERFSPAYDAAWTAGMRGRLGLAGVSDEQVVVDARALLTRFERERVDYTLGMREVHDANPLYIPRNALLDEALTAANAGELQPFERLLAAVSDPARERTEFADLAAAPEPGARRHVTYCGT